MRCLAIQQLGAKPVQAGSNRSPGSRARAAPVRARGSHSFRSRGRRAPAGLPPFSFGAALPGVSSARTSSVLLSRTLLPLAPRGGVQRAETAGQRPQPPAGTASWPGAHAPPWKPERLGCGVPAPHPTVSTSLRGIPGSLYSYRGGGIGGSLHPRGALEDHCISLGHPKVPESLPSVPDSRKNGSGSQIAWLLAASSVFPPKPKLAGTTHLYIATNQTAPPKI